MARLHPFLRILRLPNAAMTAFGVFLGFWIGYTRQSPLSLLLLVIAGIASTGFGNVLNDILDRESDRINHPDRPLPCGEISPPAARAYACGLALLGLSCGFAADPIHGVGVIAALVLLALYAFRLKATALWGNLLVSILVAYPVVFGALGGERFGHLLLPALLACLINFCREAIKDIQDARGDAAAGITTTAALGTPLLRHILTGVSVVYAAGVFVPYALGHFGIVYLVVCLAVVLPLHVWWFRFWLGREYRRRLPAVSRAIKLEMAAGMAALALDQLRRGIG